MSNFTGYSLPGTAKASRPSPLARLAGRLADAVRRLRAVNELEQLSDRQLRDIGVDRRLIEQVAEREIARLRAR
ncbi:DUF1127 domain-containing protein [Taklimakanibacter lacteus]|uniref:DUF1127 domain-containing protein n=1 Tax=Taklimakanibacter lacteus TaxID=2268456 RepID=UPI000E66DC1F